MKALSFRHKLRSFLHAEDGSALPFIGMGMMMLMAATGTAIDMGRAQVVQSRLQNSLDAAGLAAGSNISTADAQAEASKYFYANYPVNYMGSTINNLTATPNADDTMIDLHVDGVVNTTFMRIFGINTVAVSADSEITRAAKGLELVLVLDTTGSMDDSAGSGLTKIQAAKAAAVDLMNILYGTQTTIPNLWVGLVPFAQAVNIGTSRASWTSNPSMPALGWGTTSWGGCVQAREASNRDTTDDPPSVALFPKYYWNCHSSYNPWYGNNGSHTNCSTSSSGFAYNIHLGNASTEPRTPNKYCSQPITPLTATKSTVVTAINALTTDGNTHIVLGAAWGWRLLSPRWQGLWGGEMNANNLPLDYNTPLMNKAVVLMTDGDNTISSSVKGAYGYLSEGRLGTTNTTNAETQLDTRLSTVCTAMKAQGIRVYTIAFGTGISTSTQTLLRNCATVQEYYFLSPNAASLSQAFHKIADSLANLRISH